LQESHFSSGSSARMTRRITAPFLRDKLPLAQGTLAQRRWIPWNAGRPEAVFQIREPVCSVMMIAKMQESIEQLYDRALAERVRRMRERYGLEAAEGAFTLPTLEAALEVLPPPHRRFVQEHLDYYRRRYRVMEKEGAEAALVVWSLYEPPVRMIAMREMPSPARLPWVGRQPLRGEFRDAPPLTREEALRQIGCVLRAEGFTPREEPLLVRFDPEQLAVAVAARLRVAARGLSLEGTARLLVARSLACWEEEGERPQAVAVVDVGGPIPVMLAFDDPRPLIWERPVA